MKHIRASNWVAETATPNATGFKLRGTSQGLHHIQWGLGNNEEVFYSAHDDSGNREAGYAKLSGTSLVNRHPTATLVNGVYNSTAPSLVNFSSDVTLACTYNASAFNLMFESLQALDPDGDGTINIPPDLIEGLADALRSKAEQVDLDSEIAARVAGDEALQDQIDNIDVSGGGGDWADITNKPTEFPPETHTHDQYAIGDDLDAETQARTDGDADLQAQIDGLDLSGEDYDDTQIKADLATETQARIDGDAAIQAEVDDLENYDDTQIKADLATETQDRIDGDTALGLRIDAVEDSVTDGGGFVDAPNDGKLYGRQSEGWSEVPEGGVSDWADIENKPTEFPPADHDQPWSSITDTPDDYPPSVHDHAWDDVTGKPTKFPPENHTHDYLSDAPDDGAQYARQS